MNQLEVRPTWVGDCFRLAPELRRDDLNEIAAASGRSPLSELLDGYADSPDCLTIHDPAGPVAIFGVTWDGRVWLLGGDRLLAHWREFARRSRDELELLRGARGILTNHVDARNTVHVRWLRWLGAELTGPEPFGVAGLPFWRFTI